MRWSMAVAVVLFAGAAHAGFADGVPISAAEKECRFQAAIVDQTYSLYRSGASAQEAVARQTAPETPAASRRWVKQIVDSIYGDTRSMFVNQGATVYAYEHKCLADPHQYIRNKDLLK